MIEFLTCIAVDHDPTFTILAAIYCVIGSGITVVLTTRAGETQGQRHALWVFLAGIVGGATVWTTHFVAMLGYRTDLVVGYDVIPTVLSLALAVAANACAAHYAAGRWEHARLIGSVVAGVGAAGMHYLGAFAMKVNGTVEWSGVGVALSVVFAVTLYSLSGHRAKAGTAGMRLQSAILMAGGIVSLHFTGMSSMSITPGATTEAASAVPQVALAGYILAVTGTLAAMAAATFLLDFSSDRDARRHFRYLSLHDDLTGLPNRACVRARVDELAADPVASGQKVAGVLLDLDRFKDVNDVHGHLLGDHVLRTVAGRISAAIGEGDFFGRIGGDEFFAMKAVTGRSEALDFAEKLREIVALPVEWKGSSLSVSASAGVVVYPEDGVSPAVLLQRVDLAMNAAKQAGRNRVAVFKAVMEEVSRNRSLLAMDLRHAIANGELSLVFQPQNDSKTEEVVGFEALLRWKSPRHGLVSPAIFIPLAEEDGLIPQIGEWVLREACREAASWRKPLRIAVNVAPSQLGSPELVATVQAVLLQTGLKASRLELEVTETGIVADQQAALQVIRHVKALGVGIAMDDYGTGYSSLSMLHRFPFDKIKIDREFTAGIGKGAQAEAIISATLALACALRIPVLAEGVETAAQLKFLRDGGCKEIQGFLFGTPMGATEARRIAALKPVKGSGDGALSAEMGASRAHIAA